MDYLETRDRGFHSWDPKIAYYSISRAGIKTETSNCGSDIEIKRSQKASISLIDKEMEDKNRRMALALGIDLSR